MVETAGTDASSKELDLGLSTSVHENLPRIQPRIAEGQRRLVASAETGSRHEARM